MHSAVAASITAFSAGCVHDDLASHFARRRVEADRAAFKFECPFNGMKCAAKLELDFRLRWVKLSGNFLGPPGGSKNKRGERCEEQWIELHSDSLGCPGHGRHRRHVLNSFHPKSIISPTLSDETGSAPV